MSPGRKGKIHIAQLPFKTVPEIQPYKLYNLFIKMSIPIEFVCSAAQHVLTPVCSKNIIIYSETASQPCSDTHDLQNITTGAAPNTHCCQKY